MSPAAVYGLIGSSPAFLEALGKLRRFAETDCTLLIEGETGTGKEVAARMVHEHSNRCGKPFIPVNCGSLPEGLAETELFGCEKGAYTDAREARRGLIAEAEGGTLFLDEVEAMPGKAQVALLRFLQDSSFRPVGGTRICRGNVRVIAATNESLAILTARQQLRADLMFRLKVLVVSMPPLRERGDDVLEIARACLHRFSARHGKPEPELGPDTADWFCRYAWPGNIRELENTLLQSFLLSPGAVLEIPEPKGCRAESVRRDFAAMPFAMAKAEAIADFERHYLNGILARTDGNVTQAARLAGTDRSALRKLLRRHGLMPEAFRP